MLEENASSKEPPDIMAAAPADSLDEARALAKVWSGLFGAGREAPRLDHYYLLEELGSGAMGVVYSAFDTQLQRHVALKLLHRDRTSSTTARLLREARALAKVSHPNVIGVHAVGTGPGADYIAMEYVDGQSLAQWLAAGPHPWRDTLRYFVAAGRGLAAAHEAGIVHRDFKPANVLLGKDGAIRVADFGLAWEGPAALASTPEASDATLKGETDRLTATGVRVGTPAYMAPEQRRGEDASALADQFAFCVSLYEGLWGKRPPIDPDSGSPVLDLEGGPSSVVSRPPSAVIRTLQRGLKTRPNRRFASQAQLVDELEAVLHPRTARRFAPWSLAAIAVFAAAVFAAVSESKDDASNVATTDPCAAAGSEIERIWSADRRAAIELALNPGGRRLDDRRWVVDAVDRYASVWADSRTRACTRYHAGAESATLFDSRVECLDRKAQGLEAVTTLVETEALSALRVEGLLFTLGPVSECDALASRMHAVIRPEDPAERAAGQALLARVDRQYLRATAGLPHPEAAVAQIRAAAAATTDLSARGNASRFLARRTTDTDERRRLRFSVVRDSILSHDAHLLVLGYLELGELHERAGELDLSLGMLDLALAANQDLVALDPDYRASAAWFEGGIAENRARIARLQGDPAGALAAASIAARSWEPFAEDSPLWVANALNNVGEGLRLLGKPRAAIVKYDRALELSRRRLSRPTLELGVMLNNRGAAKIDAGELAAAEQDFRDAAPHLGVEPERIDPGLVEYNLGAIAFTRERYELARGHFTAAVESFSKADDIGSQLLRQTARVAVASVIREQGDPLAALAQLDAIALELVELVGTRDPRLAEVLLERSLALRKAERFEEAYEDASTAVSMQADSGVTHGADRAHYIIALAQAEIATHRPQAQGHLEEAVRLVDALESPHHPHLARTDVLLGALELEAGSGEPSRRVERAAEIVRRHELGPSLKRRVEALGKRVADGG